MKVVEGSIKILAIAVVITCSCSTVGSVEHALLFDQFYLYGLPYCNQDDPYWCGPASMSMVLGYWGINISQAAIAAEIYDSRVRITRITDMVTYPTEHGFKSQDFVGSITALKTWINSGVPLIVLQKFSLENPYGHYRVAVGYNDSSEVILAFDPTKGMNFTISYAEFAQLWQPGSTFSTANWTLTITPENDVLTNLMKQHQISMNLQDLDYKELVEKIEELGKDLDLARDETRSCGYLFTVITVILLLIVTSLGVYVATRKPKASPVPYQNFQRKQTVRFLQV